MFTSFSRMRSTALLLIVTLGMQIVSPIFQDTYANNTTYYVDATSGNDTNDGLSELSAWQSFANINVGGFGPGDQILLKCGEGWSEQLVLQDSGSSGSPITIGSYGGLCDGSNRPAMNYTGGPQITSSGSVSYIVIRDLDLSAGDAPSSIVEFMSGGTDVTLSGSLISNPSGNCIELSQTDNILITGNTITNCTTGIHLGTMTGNVTGNTFSTMGSAGPAITMSLTSSGSRTISDNSFNGLGSTAIEFGQNTTIAHNTITNSCIDFADCAAITNVTQDIGHFDLDLNSTLQENFITTVGTGILLSTYQLDGIRLGNLSRGVQVTGNTISGAQRAISVLNGRYHTISSNVLYNPRTYAIHMKEDSTSGSGEVMESNTISNNTILTYNPDYSMVRIEDTINNIGTLATLSGNKFLNVYKPKLPIIEMLKNGGNSTAADKDTLTTIDGTATNFTYFGYKTYTSTGSYSGSNAITNGSFGSNITGWSTDVLTLSHDSTGQTLHAAQGVDLNGVLSSNTFSVANGALYEISGTIKNITNSEGHAIKVRLQNSVGTLYGERDFDVVATASGTVFKEYVKSTTGAADAQLDFILSNPNTSAEFDNLVVRQVVGLVYNSRSSEAILAQNTSASTSSISCASLGIPAPFCGQYVDYSNNVISWSLSLNAYKSQIVFWNTATNILNRPSGSFVPSSGSIPNGQSVTLTWNVSNSLTQRLAGETYTGSFDYSVATSGSMSLMPPNDGTNTYTFSATNDIGTSIYTADVVTSNTPPIVDPAFATGSEDDLSITGVVTSTDVNSGGTLSYTLFDTPLNGTILNFDASGSFDYRPNGNFCGTDTFTFRAWDAYGLGNDTVGNPGVVTVTVYCMNDDPVAIDDSMSGTGGLTQLLDVLANETDPDDPYAGATAQGGIPQVYTITGLTQPTNGVVSVSGSYIEYTPDAPFYGTDSFTYMIMDQSGGLSGMPATVNLSIVPGMNLPPEVSGDSYNMNEDTLISDFLSGSDINGDSLTFTTSILPTHGTLSFVGSGFTYTPDNHYYGSDSFTFYANDGILNSSGATINITIDPLEDVPVVTDDTINVEMNTLSNLDVLVNDLDADNLSPTPQNQGLTITGYTLPSHGTLNLIGNAFQYTSDNAFTGSDSFTYIVVDPTGQISNTGVVNLTISSTNQVPTAYSGSFVTLEDTELIQTLSGSDPESVPVSFVLDSTVSNGVLNLSSTGQISYTPDLDYYGPDSFTFHVTDGVWNSSIQTITIDVTPANDLPVADNDTATGTEDSSSSFTPLDNDSDVDVGDVLSLHTIIAQPTHGSASISGSTEIVYTPTANYCGMDSIIYQDIDLSGAVSNGATIIVNVTCINDGPTANDASFSVLANIPTNSGNTLIGVLTGTDIDSPSLSYNLETDVTNGVLSLSSTGGFSYVPDLSFSGSDSFTYSVDDGSLTSSSATVTITVNPNHVNLAPNANSGSVSLNEDSSISTVVTGSDPESAPITFHLDTNVTHGTLVLQNSGSYTYTPSANYTGLDSFTFHTNDGLLDSSGATITITVTAVNDTPIVVNDTVAGTEDTASSLSPLNNDTDVDTGDILSVNTFTQGAHGSVAASGATQLTYTPVANYCGAESINYTTRDASGSVSNTGTITLTISCVNDAPIANNELTNTGTEDTTLSIAVLTNDTDIEDSIPVSIANLTQPTAGGTVGISGTNITFSPTANYCGNTPITFTYQARDSGESLSNVATVTIPAITCVNDAPIAQNASYTMTGNIVVSSGTIDGSGNLTGYVATSNVWTGVLTATDVDSTGLTYSLIASPSTGTATVMGSGTFTYYPALEFVGTMTFGFRATDGTANSNTGTITLCIVSPNSQVPLPSCAGGSSTPTTPSAGPGGGGGGGSMPAASYYASNYTTVLSSGVSDSLAAQLFLTRRNLDGSEQNNSEENPFGDPVETLPSGSLSDIVNSTPADVFITTIRTVVDTAKMTDTSTTEGVTTIRSSGRTLLMQILSSMVSDEEKIESIDTSNYEFIDIANNATTLRESLAINYLIRIFYRERAKLMIGIELINNMFTQ